jgi:hypothetical protein
MEKLMFQVGLFGVGLALICLSVVMVVVARPRKGLVVGFLDGKANAQAYYAMAMMISLALGLALLVRGAAE